MKIVGLVGPKRSGKDTAAAALTEQHGYVRVGFSDAIKRMALAVNPLVILSWGTPPERLSEVVRIYGWERAKDHFHEVRRFLNALGTDGVRETFGADSWIKAWKREAYEHDLVVVPDVRFLNEAAELACDSLLIRVVRPGFGVTDTHATETEQAGIRCDAVIVNDGTPAELQAKVLALVDAWQAS